MTGAGTATGVKAKVCLAAQQDQVFSFEPRI